MGRGKKKKLLEKKKCDVGWSHRGKCEDSSRILDSEFAISYQEDKCKIRVVYSVFSTILLFFLFSCILCFPYIHVNSILLLFIEFFL